MIDAGDTFVQQGIPSWIAEAKQYFSAVQAGNKWEALVHHWMDMEKRLGYPDGLVSYSIHLH